jgi:archaemetzincin
MPGLDLVPFNAPEGSALIERLGQELGRRFRSCVPARRPWFDPETAYDASRGQYNSTLLLHMLLEDPPAAGGHVLGITGVDLFVPVLTFVYGEAQLSGRAAVVSLRRLRAEAYGLAATEALLYERLLKEAVHELGHVHGLVHCPDPACVMRAPTCVEQVDAKSADFREECLFAVHAVAPAP